MTTTVESLPVQQSMKAEHRVRRFRRGNAEHGAEKRWRTSSSKPWKIHNPTRNIISRSN